MTGRIGSDATTKVIARITGTTGVNGSLGNLAESSFEAAQVRTQNVAAELSDKATGAKYPTMHVYCEKVVNDQKEKFRSFSGRVRMVVELRHSQDRIDGLQDALETYADAATEALSARAAEAGATGCCTTASTRCRSGRPSTGVRTLYRWRRSPSKFK